MVQHAIMPEMAPILEKSSVSADDVLTFRRAVFGDGLVSREEAESLFAVNDRVQNVAPEWHEFFIEAITDYLVRQVRPEGYISEENARWLIACLNRDGEIRVQCELDLVVKCLEKARSSPDFLSAFALARVRDAVLGGNGPYARGGNAEPGRVTDGDVAMLRRVLYAFGGDGALSISRAEAEILFDLNDATADAENDASWMDLFVKAVANAVMAHESYRAPDIAEARRREEWLESRPARGSMLGAMFRTIGRADLGAVRDAMRAKDITSERNAAFASGVVSSEPVTAAEAHWITDRIGRDGRLNANERALLDFLKAESPSVHPSLEALFRKADLAA